MQIIIILLRKSFRRRPTHHQLQQEQITAISPRIQDVSTEDGIGRASLGAVQIASALPG
jgi:hypothetical protein